MPSRTHFLPFVLALFLASHAFSQCPDNNCPVNPVPVALPLPVPVPQSPILFPPAPAVAQVQDTQTIIWEPLESGYTVELEKLDDKIQEADFDESDVLDWVINATIRVTVGGDCGSGTIVGRDGNGQTLILTNAHVAGTQRGRRVNVQRWNQLGETFRGTARIVSSGYSSVKQIDFALLACDGDFGKDAKPIPLADRESNGGRITTSGCPRCEWPSTQSLKMTRSGKQIIEWFPEAIGGRSGSSLLDYTDKGPRVVGLLTWRGGGKGIGQTSMMVLAAMRGKLPTSFESVPRGIEEVGTAKVPCEPHDECKSCGRDDDECT